MKPHSSWIVLALGAVMFATVQTARLRAEETQSSFEQTMKVKGAVILDLKTASEDVQVRRGDDGAVRIRCVVKSEDDNDDSAAVQQAVEYLKSNPPFHQDGNRIVLETEGTERFQDLSIQYQFEVPRETALKFSTGSGNVWTREIRGPIEVESDSGDGLFEAVDNPVKVQTESGDVKLEQAGAAAIEVKTESGDVHVSLPAEKGFDVTVHTDSGDISAGAGSGRGSSDDVHDLQYKVHGGGSTVNVRTVSGAIRID